MTCFPRLLFIHSDEFVMVPIFTLHWNFYLSDCSEGGFFNAIMSFPENYPVSPPTVTFTSEMWHPNGDW